MYNSNHYIIVSIVLFTGTIQSLVVADFIVLITCDYIEFLIVTVKNVMFKLY